MIKFDKNVRSQSGKMIPLEEDGSYHQCPNSQYNQQQQQQPQVYRTPNSGDAQAAQEAKPQQQQQQQSLEYGPALKALSDQIAKFTELYNDLSQYLVEINHAAKSAADKAGQSIEQLRITDAKVERLVSHFLREQELKEQEERYDQDKESGTLFPNE